MEFVELAHFALDPSSMRLLSRAFCETNKVVILGSVDQGANVPIPVGMLEPHDDTIRDAVMWALGRSVKPIQLNAHEIQKAIDFAWGGEVQRDELRLQLSPVGRLTFSSELDVPQIVTELLAHAVDLGASDVHIEAHDDDVDVRFRIDGVLRQIQCPIGPTELRRVMARLKVLAHLDIAETRDVQEGRILASFDGEKGRRPIDFRLSILPGPFGEDAVLRVLESAKQITALSTLGLSEEHAAVLSELTRSPEGLVLVTGPTGSGKTTTLYSVLHAITSHEIKVLTVEDPIEYRLAKVNQKQITHKLGFADYARAFLRQDPDVMMIGEIRDEATAEVAIRAAQTGHLVLSTLHTNDSVSAIRRLETFGIEPENLSETLLAVVAQRLVRKICAACSEESSPTTDELDGFPVSVHPTSCARGRGCEICRNQGLKGRTGIFELFVPSDEISEMIARAEPLHEIRKAARTRGMSLLLEEAMAKVAAKVTTLGEIKGALSYRLIREYEP
jgi:general secretion pathway protein E